MKSNGYRDVQHIQTYKAHKQEGTLVSKVHKQGALDTSSQASLHQVVHVLVTRAALEKLT